MARKPRHLSAEEEALWTSVAASTEPLKHRTRHPAPRAPAPSPDAQETRSPPLAPFELGAKVTSQAQTRIELAPDVATRLAAAPPAMDRKRLRKMARGRMKPEARLDLHGMTLAQAHPALLGFILSSQAAGRRLVLVITGKGRTGDDDGGPIPTRRGVLRREVPRWLTTGPAAHAVLQVAQAHPTHGGAGAWYVYLRRPRN